MHTRKILIYLAAVVVAVLVGLGIGHFTRRTDSTSPAQAGALLLHPAKALPDFNLVSDNQAPFTRANLRQQWSLLYFGYTRCPDVCPTTLADLSKVSGLLKSLLPAQQPRVYFVSVDPKRDTPDALAAYVRFFNKGFVGVTGALDELRALARPLGIGFSYDPENQAGNYTVNHSTAVLLVNPQVQEAAVFTPPIIPQHMADEYRSIVAGYGNRP